jgi:hypothetical protein
MLRERSQPARVLVGYRSHGGAADALYTEIAAHFQQIDFRPSSRRGDCAVELTNLRPRHDLGTGHFDALTAKGQPVVVGGHDRARTSGRCIRRDRGWRLPHSSSPVGST